jgi:hypothetical protein
MYLEFPPFHELFPKLSRYLQSHYRASVKIRGGHESWLGMIRKDLGKRHPREVIP